MRPFACPMIVTVGADLVTQALGRRTVAVVVEAEVVAASAKSARIVDLKAMLRFL